MARFGRVLTAMVTPFTDDGSLDVDGAVALAGWLQEQGNEGLVLAGTTGEAPTMSDAEKLTLWEAVAGRRDDPGRRRLDDQRHRTLRAPHRRGVQARQSAVCSRSARTTTARRRPASKATCGPSPKRPSCRRSSTTSRSARDARSRPRCWPASPTRCPNVVGVKDAAGNPAETARLIAVTPARL